MPGRTTTTLTLWTPRTPWCRDLLMGKCSKISEHKTGYKYPAYVWLSQWDVIYGRLVS